MAIKVLKICVSEWNGEGRDRRELSVCRELGAEVAVIAKGKTKDWLREDRVSGFHVLRLSARPLGVRYPKALNRFVSLFTWAYATRKMAPDIISGHDISGLLIGWMSTWFVPKAKKPKLVYDSHEFEIGRNAERSRANAMLITYLERFLIKRCALTIVVNDSIADEVQRIHKLPVRPLVVRNTPPLWERNESECRRIRKEFYEALQVSDDTFLVMYHGGVMQNRGVENMLRAIALTPGTAGVVLGNGDVAYLAALKRQATELGVAERVLFHPAVSIDVLKNYVGAVDCGLVILQYVCKNHYYALPNKFFENIQSEIPVIGSAFPEISYLVNKYEIGLLCDPDKPEDISKCIIKMKRNKTFYNDCKANVKTAKYELCWEKEKKVLMEAYEHIIPLRHNY